LLGYTLPFQPPTFVLPDFLGFDFVARFVLQPGLELIQQQSPRQKSVQPLASRFAASDPHPGRQMKQLYSPPTKIILMKVPFGTLQSFHPRS
jgi:hypothetical protein